MRILIVITGLGVGGAERLVTQLADRFVAAGHTVRLAWLVGDAQIAPLDERVELVPLHMSKSLRGVFSSVMRLRQLVREFDPDVVNSHMVHANLLARAVRLVTPMARLVNSAHNTNEGGRLRMLGYRITDWLADISTNVSEEAVSAFVDQGALRSGRMTAVYNGIDTALFAYDSASRIRLREELGMKDDQPMLLAVGRLSAEKDYMSLLRAFARLANAADGPRLVIVGDGPLRAELAALAESLGVAPQVSFLGVRDDVPALMSACDVFVLSSAWEGFGLVVAEAMACERVVVATDSGGVREVVGDAGWLVPPRDAEALAVALADVLALSPAERVRYGELARARVVSRYSIDATASRYLALFEANV